MAPIETMKAGSLPNTVPLARNQLSEVAPVTANSLHVRKYSLRPLRVGFVPLCDCAPIVMAHELGFFAQQGLEVVLSREVGWATVREKIIYGELDAAQATAAMVFAITLGLGSVRMPCVTGMVLNLHGNAITLASRLWEAGVRDGATLREYVKANRGKSMLTFGVVFRFSAHDYLLRKFLRTHGIEPERDVRIVVVPPPQMPGNLKAGNLDGFCVGEPWNSVAVIQRSGWVVDTSAAIAPLHPEKVLLVRHEFAETRADEHLKLIAALRAAGEYCDQPQNRQRIADVLMKRKYVNANPLALRRSLCGPFDVGKGKVESIPNFHIFSRYNANEPTVERERTVVAQMRESGALPADAARGLPPQLCFRPDIFERSNPQPKLQPTHLLTN